MKHQLSVGVLNRARPDAKSVARLVKQILEEAAGHGWVTQIAINEVLAGYPPGSRMRLAVHRELRTRGIHVITSAGFRRMRMEVKDEQQASAAEVPRPVDQTIVAQLLDQAIGEAEEVSPGRWTLRRALVRKLLRRHRAGSIGDFRKAVYRALEAQGIELLPDGQHAGRRLVRRKKLSDASLRLDHEGVVDTSEAPIRMKGEDDLRAGFRESDLDHLAGKFFNESQPQMSIPHSALPRRKTRMIRSGGQSLASRPEVRRAAFDWLREKADHGTGEVAGPLRSLALHLVFLELIPHPPSTSEIREILEALREVDLVGKYDEERAVVRVVLMHDPALPDSKRRRGKNSARGVRT